MRLRSSVRSTTATALASEHVTKRRSPVPLSESAEGVMPAGSRGSIDTLMFSMTRNSPDSETPTTRTPLVLEAATNNRAFHA